MCGRGQHIRRGDSVNGDREDEERVSKIRGKGK
jgi:hypothetical protein